MIELIFVFISCLFGYLIAKFTKEELKSGAIYFKILELIIILICCILFLFNDFNLLFFIIGLVIGIIIRFEYLYFGLGLSSSLVFNQEFVFVISSLVFIYGLAYGSLIYYYKKWKYLVYSSVLFILGFFVYLLGYNLISISSGALLSIFLRKSFDLFMKK